MPEMMIQIGGRGFTVNCQEGEEKFLQSAADALDKEASTLISQIGQLPESRMLLMAGLMLADKYIGTLEGTTDPSGEITKLQTRIAELEKENAQINAASLNQLATMAEELADRLEEKTAAL